MSRAVLRTMGAAASGLGRLFSKEKLKVLMLGLDSTGKSTILSRLMGRQDFIATPTIGSGVGTLSFQDFDLDIWDFGGGEMNRYIWHCYLHSTHGVIFVVNSTDRARIDEARNELHNGVLDYPGNDSLRGCPVLIFANKQDLPKAMDADEVAEKLGVHELEGTRWHVQPSCGTTGEGLAEGLHWLAENVKKDSEHRRYA